jgi:hypothetical protein
VNRACTARELLPRGERMQNVRGERASLLRLRVLQRLLSLLAWLLRHARVSSAQRPGIGGLVGQPLPQRPSHACMGVQQDEAARGGAVGMHVDVLHRFHGFQQRVPADQGQRAEADRTQLQACRLGAPLAPRAPPQHGFSAADLQRARITGSATACAAGLQVMWAQCTVLCRGWHLQLPAAHFRQSLRHRRFCACDAAHPCFCCACSASPPRGRSLLQRFSHLLPRRPWLQCAASHSTARWHLRCKRSVACHSSTCGRSVRAGGARVHTRGSCAG